MDSGTTIIVLILLAICLVPIILINSKSKNRKKLFLQSLYSLAEQSNCKISEHDSWNDTTIGLDKDQRKVFYIRKTANDEDKKEINLSEIQRCRIIETSRAVSLKNSTQKVVDKLELAFTYREKNRPEQLLEFYSTDHDNFSLSGELQLTEKWSGNINALLANGQ